MLIHSGTGLFYFLPSGPAEFALLALTCAVSGFVQELVMRAYLITRFEELFESKSVAILLSTVLFIGYHGYQGPAGVVSVALFGFILAIVFCLFRRVVPISLAHAIYNFIAIGRVAWL
jgi:CAAX protease family protein